MTCYKYILNELLNQNLSKEIEHSWNVILGKQNIFISNLPEGGSQILTSSEGPNKM